jgi:hypothetical protein
MMSGTVKIPGLGEVKKGYAVAAGAAVAGIVGVGYYRKRQQAAIPVTTDQTSVDAFGSTTPVGPGGSNGVTNQAGDPVLGPIVQPTTTVTSNSEWLGLAQDTAQQLGIPDATAQAALRKILGGSPVTQTEIEVFHQIVGVINAPPQGYPAIHLTTTAPSGPLPANHGIYDVQVHQISVTTGARELVQRFSDTNASSNQIETALRKTVADSRNGRYRAFYGSHGGQFPAQAKLYVTVVKTAGEAGVA